jgi:hypothetical protein
VTLESGEDRGQDLAPGTRAELIAALATPFRHGFPRLLQPGPPQQASAPTADLLACPDGWPSSSGHCGLLCQLAILPARQHHPGSPSLPCEIRYLRLSCPVAPLYPTTAQAGHLQLVGLHCTRALRRTRTRTRTLAGAGALSVLECAFLLEPPFLYDPTAPGHPATRTGAFASLDQVRIALRYRFRRPCLPSDLVPVCRVKPPAPDRPGHVVSRRKWLAIR